LALAKLATPAINWGSKIDSSADAPGSPPPAQPKTDKSWPYLSLYQPSKRLKPAGNRWHSSVKQWKIYNE